jgi:hypothetical protein
MFSSLCTFFPPPHSGITTLTLPTTTYCVMETNLSSPAILQGCTGNVPISIPFDNIIVQGTGCYTFSIVAPRGGKVVQPPVEARNCIREALVRDRFGNGMTSDWVECRQIGRDVTSGNGGKQGSMSKTKLLVMGIGIVSMMVGLV